MNKLLQYFSYKHLKDPALQDTSSLFSALAHELEKRLPGNPEKTTCFRKLLEAKDCAVRAHIYVEPVDESAPRDAPHTLASPPSGAERKP